MNVSCRPVSKPWGHPANISRAAAWRIYVCEVQSAGVFLQGSLGNKGRSFPEVLIKFVIDIDCDAGLFEGKGYLYGMIIVFFCVTPRGVLLDAAASRTLESLRKVLV